MIAESELRKSARAKLRDAEVLLRRGRYDGAAYVCGYAMEMVLKARICRTLKWAGYPDTRKEFESLTSFKTHDLDILLKLSGSGIGDRITARFPLEWRTMALSACWDNRAGPRVGYGRGDQNIVEVHMKELLKKFAEIEKEIAAEKGGLLLFGLFQRKPALYDRWEVFVSAPWLVDEGMKTLKYFFDKFETKLSAEEMKMIKTVRVLNPAEPLVKEIAEEAEWRNGTARVSDYDFNGMTIRRGHIITAKQVRQAA